MLDPVADWAEGFKNLPKVAGPEWASNFSALVASLTDNKLEVVGSAPPSVFTFNQDEFIGALSGLSPTPSASQGGNSFADAWGIAVLASTMVCSGPVGSAAFTGPPETNVTPGSVSAAKATLAAALASGPKVDNPADSAFPGAFRAAFLALKYEIAGSTADGAVTLPEVPVS